MSAERRIERDEADLWRQSKTSASARKVSRRDRSGVGSLTRVEPGTSSKALRRAAESQRRSPAMSNHQGEKAPPAHCLINAWSPAADIERLMLAPANTIRARARFGTPMRFCALRSAPRSPWGLGARD